MSIALKAIEVDGTVDEQQFLHVDEPLPICGPNRVRVIVLTTEVDGTDETEWLRLAAANPAFDFLKAPEEDLYTIADGRPFYGER